MANAFTPGPWTFSHDNQFGDTRFYVAQQEGAPYTPDYSDVATLIAETCSGDRVAVQQANARLIAAAPELLEALRKLADAYERLKPPGYPLSDPEKQARAVIAKATGSTP